MLIADDGQIIGRIVESEFLNPQTHQRIQRREEDLHHDQYQVVYKTVPWHLEAGDYTLRTVIARLPLAGGADGGPDRLVQPTPVSYDFADSAVTKALDESSSTWTITLPDFVWQRLSDQPEDIRTTTAL